MSSEKFKIIINKAIKNIQKYKIFKEEDIQFINKTLWKYSINNNVMIFGNFALSLLYPKEPIYISDSVPEVKFNHIANVNLEYTLYSSNIVKDLFSLIGILEKRFKYIKGYSSYNPYEYVLEINFKALIRLYYCPEEVLKNLPNKNNILSPKYLLLDVLNKLITPLSNYYYLLYNNKQWELILDNIKTTKLIDIKFEDNNKNLARDVLNNYLSYNKSSLIVGDLAYKLINDLNIDKDLGVIEFFSCCVMKDLQDIFDKLLSKYKIKIKKINSFFIYFSYYYEVYLNNKLLMKIYNLNTTYNYITIKSFQVLNVQGQILFLLNKILECKYKKEEFDRYDDMINNYLIKYRKSKTYKNFQINQTNLIGPTNSTIEETIKNISYNPIKMNDFQKKEAFKRYNKIKFPSLLPEVLVEKEMVI